MTMAMRPRWPTLVAAVLLAGGAMTLVGGSAGADPVGGPARYDGRFVFARVRYTDGYAGGGVRLSAGSALGT